MAEEIPSTSSISSYAEWTKDRKILKSFKNQLQKGGKTSEEILKEIRRKDWKLEDVRASGIKEVIRNLEKSKDNEVRDLAINVGKKFNAQRLREENPERKKERGFRFECEGILKYSTDDDGLCLIMDGRTSQGKSFRIPVLQNLGVMRLFRELREKTGLPRKSLRLEIDGITIEEGKRLSSYYLESGQ